MEFSWLRNSSHICVLTVLIIVFQGCAGNLEIPMSLRDQCLTSEIVTLKNGEFIGNDVWIMPTDTSKRARVSLLRADHARRLGCCVLEVIVTVWPLKDTSSVHINAQSGSLEFKATGHRILPLKRSRVIYFAPPVKMVEAILYFDLNHLVDQLDSLSISIDISQVISFGDNQASLGKISMSNFHSDTAIYLQPEQ
jgi:hypothetical protein